MSLNLEPVSVPVSPESAPVRRRAVFSRSVFGLEFNHVNSIDDDAAAKKPHRRKVSDDSLRLIGELTNRSVDPMFFDAQLATKQRSLFTVWSTRVIVFVICVGVGFVGSLFVRQLHTDPRKEVRTSLTYELLGQNKRVKTLGNQVDSLKSAVDEQSQRLSYDTGDSPSLRDNMINGQVPVSGQGITLTLADPISASSARESGGLPRENAVTHIRVVTDLDLQQMTSLLWQSGAEAIAINGKRLGTQTAIRLAGQAILVGADPVQSPYKIEAIGNRNALARNLGRGQQPALYASYRQSGISLQMHKEHSLKLSEATAVTVSNAERGK